MIGERSSGSASQRPSERWPAASARAPRVEDTGTAPPSTPTAAGRPTPTPTPGPAGARHTVDLTDDLAFDPDSIEVAVGDTVVWENAGSIAHTVTAYGEEIPDGAAYFASGGFHSEGAAREGFPDGSVGEGEGFEYTFETAGEYGYFCVPHERVGITGTITVR